ncbi:unnamed protein product [Pleuronectes platessa]|uniref:Uncharacterized protein n=1 Tax=Pleuronectes platessa TaxID=8262 RepID=A0A9N7TXU1_PLEPL|nr:unnamed protein product [Pleuronectes platessa]
MEPQACGRPLKEAIDKAIPRIVGVERGLRIQGWGCGDNNVGPVLEAPDACRRHDTTEVSSRNQRTGSRRKLNHRSTIPFLQRQHISVFSSLSSSKSGRIAEMKQRLPPPAVPPAPPPAATPTFLVGSN